MKTETSEAFARLVATFVTSIEATGTRLPADIEQRLAANPLKACEQLNDLALSCGAIDDMTDAILAAIYESMDAADARGLVDEETLARIARAYARSHKEPEPEPEPEPAPRKKRREREPWVGNGAEEAEGDQAQEPEMADSRQAFPADEPTQEEKPKRRTRKSRAQKEAERIAAEAMRAAEAGVADAGATEGDAAEGAAADAPAQDDKAAPQAADDAQASVEAAAAMRAADNTQVAAKATAAVQADAPDAGQTADPATIEPTPAPDSEAAADGANPDSTPVPTEDAVSTEPVAKTGKDEVATSANGVSDTEAEAPAPAAETPAEPAAEAPTEPAAEAPQPSPATKPAATPASADELGEVLTVDVALGILKVSRPTMYKLIETGKVRAYKKGRSWQISADDVNAIAASR